MTKIMKKKSIKGILSIMLVLSLIFTGLFSVTASAAVSEENQMVSTDITGVFNRNNYIEGLISVEEFQAMKLKSISTRSTNSSSYILGYNNFIPYAQSEFTQTNGCGPTAVANILSFYQGARGVSLFSGDSITQSIYDQICSDVNWSSSGSNMYNVSNGLQTFCNRAGKTCSINTYWLNLWSDVTRDIDAGLPILVNNVTQRHIMVILGYAIENDQKYLYVCSGLIGDGQLLFGYFPWGTNDLNMRSVYIY